MNQETFVIASTSQHVDKNGNAYLRINAEGTVNKKDKKVVQGKSALIYDESLMKTLDVGWEYTGYWL